MSTEPYLASIVLFAGNFAPRGWQFCAGQILAKIFVLVAISFVLEGTERWTLHLVIKSVAYGEERITHRFRLKTVRCKPPEESVFCIHFDRARLFRVGDEEGVLLGEVVHPGAGGEVGGVLLAAVQHDDQGHRSTGVAGGEVEIVASGPGRFGVAEVADLAAGCGRGRGGVRGPGTGGQLT